MDREEKDAINILPYLAPALRSIISCLPARYANQLEEIRLRLGRPLWIRLTDGEWFLTPDGSLTREARKAYLVREEDIMRSLAAVSENSVYALEEELRRGFITIRGGHRVGLAGKAVIEKGRIKTLKEFSSLVYRIARDVPGCADRIVPAVLNQNGEPMSTIIISPPGCGKTTILRDLACQLSNGTRGKSFNVVIVDERSELAGCFRGVPQLAVGDRTDILDGCPKAEGIMMAIRALSPRIVVTDELGRSEDCEAIKECLNAGVTVLATAHAATLEEAFNRPGLREIFQLQSFRVGILLSRRRGPATVEQVVRLDQTWRKIK